MKRLWLYVKNPSANYDCPVVRAFVDYVQNTIAIEYCNRSATIAVMDEIEAKVNAAARYFAPRDRPLASWYCWCSTAVGDDLIAGMVTIRLCWRYRHESPANLLHTYDVCFAMRPPRHESTW